MSIILAGLYDNGKGVAMIADTGRTSIDPKTGKEITYDRKDINKIKKVNHNLYVLLAGDTAITLPFYNELKSSEPKSNLAEVIRQAEKIYEKLKEKDIKEKVLLHFGYRNLEQFKSDNKISQQCAKIIIDKIQYHTTDFDCIIVGKKSGLYIIYALIDPRAGTFVQQEVYANGGYLTAQDFAENILRKEYFQNLDKNKAIDILIKAKEHARKKTNYIGKKHCKKTLPV